MHRSFVTAVVLAAITASVADAAPTRHHFSHVRVLHPEIMSTLALSREASPTLDSLLAELEASDVIVHVVAAWRHHRATLGSMHWVTAAGGFRFLRISIARHLDPRRRAAILAHELQHAHEVARSPGVVDLPSFAALYRRIGDNGHHRICEHCYDTIDARRTAQIVWSELGRVRFGF